MELQLTASDSSLLDLDQERELVDRAAADPQAFAQLYRMHYGAVANYLHHRTGDAHVTEDLLSEVFLSAMRALPRYRHRGVAFRLWLYRIASNAANRRLRRERLLAMALRWLAFRSAGAEHPNIDADRVRIALSKLSTTHQTVLVLHHLEHLTIEQLALVLQCRPGTVKSRLDRARAALRQLLEEGHQP